MKRAREDQGSGSRKRSENVERRRGTGEEKSEAGGMTASYTQDHVTANRCPLIKAPHGDMQLNLVDCCMRLVKTNHYDDWHLLGQTHSASATVSFRLDRGVLERGRSRVELVLEKGGSLTRFGPVTDVDTVSC